MNSSATERGGLKEVSFLISGQDVYRQLKFESGVPPGAAGAGDGGQRPDHTSTVTVAVLPEAEEVDVRIDPQELEITVQRAAVRAGRGHHDRFRGAHYP